MTTALEVYVQKQGSFPDIKNLNKIMKVIVSDCLPEFSEGVVKTLEKTRQEMLEEQGEYRSGFEKRLYKRWKMPLDLLECLIRISLESIEQHAINLGKTTDKTNNYKREAFIRIHARALQICNEILVLLKSGYPDGANSRWRTLHELAVISLFLTDNNNDVSRRYLEHDAVKRFKEAVDYKSCYRKLGYPPFGRKEFNKVKKEYDSVIAKHGNDFRGDYGWIPRTVLADRNFMGLENHVKLGKLRPFYNLSCNAVHGGARGFYRLGLMDQYQDKIVAVGPSNYGLADPLQNAAISLLHISNCVLAEEPDFESVIEMQIMDYFVNEIGIKAVEVQKQIEREETTASR